MPPKDKLVPLPLGEGLIPVNAPPATAPIKAEAVETRTPTEIWLEEHPDGFDETAAVQAVKPPIPLDETEEEVIEGEEGETEGELAPEDEEHEPVVAAKPEGEQSVSEPVVAAKPAAAVEPAAKTYEPDEKFALAEGIDWTRQQVIDALHERADLQAFKPEAETFRSIFRMTAEQAQQIWAPVIDRIVAEPKIAQFIDGYMKDGAKAEYLEQCAAYYDAENPQPVAAQPAPVDPAVQRQLKELTDWKAEREKREAVERFNRETEIVKARYPFVTADAGLFTDLRETARYLYAQDPSKGLLDALALKAPLYESLAIARNQKPMAPALEPVPVLPSAGAAPAASKPRTITRRRKFADTTEATAAWLAEHPDGFEE